MVTHLLWRMNHVDTVTMYDAPHATENPSTSSPRINFLGLHKIIILFAGNFAISEIVDAKNQAPILNAKGWDRDKSLDIVQQQPVKCLHYCSRQRPIYFSCTWHCRGVVCCGGISNWRVGQWLRYWHSLHPLHISAVANQYSCGKTMCRFEYHQTNYKYKFMVLWYCCIW